MPPFLLFYNWYFNRIYFQAFLGATNSFKDRTHGQHFTRNTTRGVGDQLTITANHHHEGAPLTVALMSDKRHFGLMCCARH